MEIASKELAIELVNKALPYAQHIGKWDLSKDDAVYFTWRHDRFKLELKFCSVMEVTNNGAILEGSNISILMGQLIKIRLIEHSINNP